MPLLPLSCFKYVSINWHYNLNFVGFSWQSKFIIFMHRIRIFIQLSEFSQLKLCSAFYCYFWVFLRPPICQLGANQSSSKFWLTIMSKVHKRRTRLSARVWKHITHIGGIYLCWELKFKEHSKLKKKKNLIGEEIGGCHKVKKEIPPEFPLLRRFDRGLTNRKN